MSAHHQHASFGMPNQNKETITVKNDLLDTYISELYTVKLLGLKGLYVLLSFGAFRYRENNYVLLHSCQLQMQI